MKCQVCGATLRSIKTDLPLKVSERTIVVVKKLPVMQCEGCIEYLIEDPVMVKVDELLSGSTGRSSWRSYRSPPDRDVLALGPKGH